MNRRKRMRNIMMPALLVALCCNSVLAQAARKSLAARCAPDLDHAKERVFSNPDGQTWKEYASTRQVPRSTGAGRSVMTLQTSLSGKHFLRTTEYGEQSARYTAACYDQQGHLRTFHYEMRTGSGWGYEDVRSFNAAGKPLNKSTRYLDTKNNQTIGRPSQAGSVPDFTKPRIYNNFDSLPIAGALKQNATAK